MRSLLLTTASLALVASAGLASAQPHERGGGPGGPAGGMHAPGGPPPAIPAAIRKSGIHSLEIYLTGNRLFMVMEVGPEFSATAKA